MTCQASCPQAAERPTTERPTTERPTTERPTCMPDCHVRACTPYRALWQVTGSDRLLRIGPGAPLVLGDLHGRADLLELTLRRGRDLILVGDLIGRGPDCLGTLRLAREAQRQGRLKMVLGNHELAMLSAVLGEDDVFSWTPVAGAPYLRGHGVDPARWTLPLPERPALPPALIEEANWIRSWPLWIRHAGVLISHGVRPSRTQHPSFVAWGRPKLDPQPPLRWPARASIHGHTYVGPRPLRRSDEEGPSFYIDLGADWNGRLGWVDLESGCYGRLSDPGAPSPGPVSIDFCEQEHTGKAAMRTPWTNTIRSVNSARRSTT